MNRIRQELEQNPRKFVQELMKLLNQRWVKRKAIYKAVLALAYLKEKYEEVFPETKHGFRLQRSSSHKVSSDDTFTNAPNSVSIPRTVSAASRTVVSHLLEGISVKHKMPSFVTLMGERSHLSRVSVQNRIQIGTFMLSKGLVDRTLRQFREGKVKYTHVLKHVKRHYNKSLET